MRSYASVTLSGASTIMRQRSHNGVSESEIESRILRRVAAAANDTAADPANGSTSVSTNSGTNDKMKAAKRRLLP